MSGAAIELSSLIGRIYDAALGSDDWQEVLCQIADWSAVENAAMVAVDPAIAYASVVTPRADPSVVSDYNENWWALDPTSAATGSAPVGQITSLSFTGVKKFYASPFYNDFWRHSGLGAERLATNLFVGDGAFASFVLQASTRRDTVEGDTTERFRQLVPHIVRANGIARSLHRAELERQNVLLRPLVGTALTLIVDATGRLLHADSGAESFVSSHPSLQLSQGVIALADPKRDDALKIAIRTAAGAVYPGLATTSIAAPDAAKGTDLSIEVLPIRTNVSNPSGPTAAAMLVLRDPTMESSQRIAQFKSAFGLTSAEAQLALEISKGDGRQAAAARCGISVNTARTHLVRIFDKTGVRRQAELTRLMLQYLPGREN